MLKLTAQLGTIIAAAMLAIALALPTSSAMASGKSCQLYGPLYTCIYVNGSGLHINYIQGSVYNERAGNQYNVHIQLTWPSGATIKNCASTTVPSLGTIYCTWSPNANEPGGNYCTHTWQYIGGHYYEHGRACLDVHP
jgi:hypothetical protein